MLTNQRIKKAQKKRGGGGENKEGGGGGCFLCCFFFFFFYSFFLSSLMPSSFNCFSVIGAGEPIIKSRPSPVFGKAMTSRIFGSFCRIITMRSMPGAKPPCGGAPKVKASSICPNFFCCSSSLIFKSLKTCFCTSRS